MSRYPWLVGDGQREREAIMESMLLCAGELGYREASVEGLCARAGADPTRFYRHFNDKADCFVTAYAWKAGQLADRLVILVEEGGESEQRAHRVLEAIATFANRQETLTRSLVVEVRSAGPRGLSERQQVMKRISDAVTRTWPQTRTPHSPVATTAEFLVSAVDQALATALLVGASRDFSRAIPELVALIRPYLDEPGAPR